MKTALVATLLSFIASASAVDLTGRIEWNEICPGPSQLGDAQVLLDDGVRWSAEVRRDGSFNIPNVETGEYLLSVLAHDYLFEQFRVLASKDAEPVILPSIPGTLAANAVKLSYPLSLLPRRKNSYYVARESFNLVGMFQNPMMLLMAFAGVMVFATPYLMKNLDPETAREVQERHSAMVNMQGSIQDMNVGQSLASIFGGSEEASSSQSDGRKPTGQTKTGTTPRGKGKARRK